MHISKYCGVVYDCGVIRGATLLPCHPSHVLGPSPVSLLWSVLVGVPPPPPLLSWWWFPPPSCCPGGGSTPPPCGPGGHTSNGLLSRTHHSSTRASHLKVPTWDFLVGGLSGGFYPLAPRCEPPEKVPTWGLSGGGAPGSGGT